MTIRLTLTIIFFCILGFSQNVFNVARNGTLIEMKEIMKANKEMINQTNEYSFSPLILACYHQNKEVAEFLIENVDNIDYISSEGTALAAVSVRYDKDLVLKLLNKKANPNLQDSRGVTPLIWAIKFKNIELIKILLDFGADKTIADYNNITPFEFAIESKNQDIINLLKSQ